MISDLLLYISAVSISYLLTEYFHAFNTDTYISTVSPYVVSPVLGVYDGIERLEKEFKGLRGCGGN